MARQRPAGWPTARPRAPSARERASEGADHAVRPGTGGAAGFKGTIELGVDRVDLAVQLGLFVAPLRLMVEAELAHDLDQLVARDF